MVEQVLQVSSDASKSGTYEDAKSLDEFHIETFTVQFDKREKSLTLFNNSHQRDQYGLDNLMELQNKFNAIGELLRKEFTQWQKQKN